MSHPPAPDEPHGDWPQRLLRALANAPLIPEDQIDWYMRGGRSDTDELSPSEAAVLRYLSRGLTPGETAVALGKSLDTVKTQLKGAKYKLRAKTTTQACCEAIRSRQIP